MAARRVELGPVGETVRAQVAAARKRRGLTLRDLSERVTESGRTLAYNSLSEIERGARRVDVDDLVALATALEVSPGELLSESPVPEWTTMPISDGTHQMIMNLIEIDRKIQADGHN